MEPKTRCEQCGDIGVGYNADGEFLCSDCHFMNIDESSGGEEFLIDE